jgi:hypothetical protein
MEILRAMAAPYPKETNNKPNVLCFHYAAFWSIKSTAIIDLSAANDISCKDVDAWIKRE